MNKHDEFIKESNGLLSLEEAGTPAVQFISLPAPGAKLRWNASLNDFVAMVVITEDFGVVPGDDDHLDIIAEQYRTMIDVDYAGCSDFEALRLAYPERTNRVINMVKLCNLEKAHGILLQAEQVTAFKHFTAFVVQADYHSVVAEEITKHWPQLNLIKLTYLFDMLFLPDEFIDEVLERAINP